MEMSLSLDLFNSVTEKKQNRMSRNQMEYVSEPSIAV